MGQGKDRSPKIPSFSVILIMVVLSIVGFGLLQLLNIQYKPSSDSRSASVNYSWSGASARVIESEVTSKIEGIIASVKGVRSINSVSHKGRGSVTFTMKKNADMDAARFEVGALMRQLYPSLADGVSYPVLSKASSGEQTSPILTYTFNADMPSSEIEAYARENILKVISLVEGVGSIYLSGANPFVLEVAYDPELLYSYGIAYSELGVAIRNGLEKNDIVGNVPTADGNNMTLVLGSEAGGIDFHGIVVKNIGGKIVRLSDVAAISYKELAPSSYSRINGLNTINISVMPDKYVNTIDLCSKIKERMSELELSFPRGYSVLLTYDASEYLKSELHKILIRSCLSLLILLLFVFLASRSWRYLVVITITMLCNILIAFIFYYLFNLEIHLFSLAGITVSLGIIIDTSIIMIDHYGYYRNRGAFLAILAATLTTMGSLMIIFFLPDSQKANLVDFAAVIIVNLSVSIFISLIFIPALMEKFPIHTRKKRLGRRKALRLARFNRLYCRYIMWCRRHRWVVILILILSFGVPVHLLPRKIKGESKYAQLYNKTIGAERYQQKIKPIIEKTLGGSLRYFTANMSGGKFDREPQKTTLYINASLPEGCTVEQLNQIMLFMENYLSQFDEIERFTTNIYSHDNGSIVVTFKPQAEKSGFALLLKNSVISKAVDFGGATWSVYGVDENGFSNNISSQYKPNRITLTGYNYDDLYRYALYVQKKISSNRRVRDADLFGQVGWGNKLARNEFFIDFHHDRIAMNRLSFQSTYQALQEKLHTNNVGSYFDGKRNNNVQLVSSKRDDFDVWHLGNEYLYSDNRAILFSDIGNISRKRSGNDIHKSNQQYTLTVAFDFIGSYELLSRLMSTTVEELNEEILPVGYKASTPYRGGGGGGSSGGGGKQFRLILLVIAVIFFFCSVLFESLRQPLAIVMLIPVSFIGLFLTFAIGGFTFDQGGFAAMIMLAGLVVNAGIYILNQYNLRARSNNDYTLRNYLYSFNHKIVPITLTVVSTVLGLIPFLLEGDGEVFWFAFAVGTMGGMIFSIVAVIFVLPIFTYMPHRSRTAG